MTDLLNEIFIEDKLQQDANKKALLLAQTRFRAQILPFVGNKPERLAFARNEVDRIVAECATQMGADVEYVQSRFDAYIADAVAVSEPQKIELEFSQAELNDGSPPKRNDPDKVNPEPDATTEVTDSGIVLEEGVDPDATVDLNDDTQKTTCFRCGGDIQGHLASSGSKVCVVCTFDLRNKLGLGQSPTEQYMVPADPNARVECTFCAQKGQHFEGTQDEVNQHITSSHQPELMQQHMQPQFNVQPVAALDDSETVDDNASNPSHHFDDVIQQMADRAAAQQFSQADDQEVQEIAQRYGLNPDEIKKNLIATATFGNFTAVNGQLTDDGVPDGYTEVEMEGMGGRVESHDAQVPVQAAVNKVAQDLQMEPDLVYSELRDSYGTDLGDQYHASVSGEHRFFLPNNMIEAHQ
jgi:hypothetical protein